MVARGCIVILFLTNLLFDMFWLFRFLSVIGDIFITNKRLLDDRLILGFIMITLSSDLWYYNLLPTSSPIIVYVMRIIGLFGVLVISFYFSTTSIETLRLIPFLGTPIFVSTFLSWLIGRSLNCILVCVSVFTGSMLVLRTWTRLTILVLIKQDLLLGLTISINDVLQIFTWVSWGHELGLEGRLVSGLLEVRGRLS